MILDLGSQRRRDHEADEEGWLIARRPDFKVGGHQFMQSGQVFFVEPQEDPLEGAQGLLDVLRAVGARDKTGAAPGRGQQHTLFSEPAHETAIGVGIGAPGGRPGGDFGYTNIKREHRTDPVDDDGPLETIGEIEDAVGQLRRPFLEPFVGGVVLQDREHRFSCGQGNRMRRGEDFVPTGSGVGSFAVETDRADGETTAEGGAIDRDIRE